MTRSFFNEQLFDPTSIYQESKIGSCNVIFNMTERLIAFSNKQPPFVRWLLGLNSLISKGQALQNAAVNDRDTRILTEQRDGIRSELESIDVAQLTTSIKERFSSTFDNYLTKKIDFITKIPKPNIPKVMPLVFERWRNNELAAIPYVSGGKPMTYKNLITEKQATEREIGRARSTMVWKRSQTNHSVSFFDAGQAESDRIDGAYGVLSHVEKELKELRDNAPSVKINTEDSRPYVSITGTTLG